MEIDERLFNVAKALLVGCVGFVGIAATAAVSMHIAAWGLSAW